MVFVYNKNCDGAFRKSGSIAIKDKNGDLLQIDNFKLDFDFKMYADGTYDHSNIAVGFHANQPYLERGRKTQALFAISPFGGYFLGDNFDIKTGDTNYKIFNKSTKKYDDFTATADKSFTASHGYTNTATSSKGMVWPYVSDAAVGHNTGAHLTLTVVGNTATAKVTKGETVILEKTVTLSTYYGSGYLFLSGANQQGWYANIEVTRLDANGNPVDFSDDNEGWTFGESFDAKATYHSDDSKFWRNTGKDVFWMEGGNATYYKFNDPTTYAEDAATVAHLKEKFDFWAYREGSEKKLTEPYQSTEDVLSADTYLKTAAHLYYSVEGLTMYPDSTGGGEALRKGFTILPKINGKTIKSRNVELVTDVVLTWHEHNFSVWNIDLRSKNEGEFITSASANKYATHVGVQIRPDGINIVDGTAFPTYTADITAAAGYSKWNDGTTHYNVRVYAKLVNDKLTVKVTDSKTNATIYEVTDKAITYVSEGYVALSTGQAWATISNLYVNVLDGKGGVIDPENLSDASDSYVADYNVSYNNLFPFGTEKQAAVGIPAYLQHSKNINRYDHLNFTADGQHFYYKDREYAVADGYSLVTEGDVTSIMKDGAVVASTEDYTVDAIGYKDEEQTIIKITSNNAEMNALVNTGDGFLVKALEYLNARFDAYYVDTKPYKGTDLMHNNWGTELNAIYGNEWLQFGGLSATVDKSADPVDNHISLMVPKSPLNGQYLKADDFNLELRIRLNDASNYGTAYVVFNMPEAGNIGGAAESNGAINFNSDLNAVKINKTQLQLWNGTAWVDLIPDAGYVGANNYGTMKLNVRDGKLTGSMQFNGKSVQSFEADLTNKTEGYFAIGHNGGGLNFGAITIKTDVNFSGKIATVNKTEGGKITVERVTSDQADLYKYIVTATPNTGRQLKANSLKAVDEYGNTLYPAYRVGFQKSVESGKFVFYANSSLTIDAKFCVARDVSEINMANLGTSYHKESGGLRFLSRVAVATENGVQFALIDGKKYELADYGMILTTKQALDWGALNGKGTELELNSDNPYIKSVSVKEAKKFYDLCDEYMDISTRIIGLDRIADGFNVRMYGRAYVTVKLADGKTETVYTDAFDSTYNETAEDLLTTVYLDSQNGDDANIGTEDAPVKSLKAASEKVVYGGNIVNMGTLTLESSLGAAQSYKLITLTGGTYKFGARHTNQISPVIFRNTTIEIPNYDNTEVWFACGHKLVIEDTVTMTGHFDNLFGGNWNVTDLDKTELEIYAGNFHNIFGGSVNKTVNEAHVTVGGNVNAALKSEAEGGSHNVGVWGGSNDNGIPHATYITDGGNAYAYMIYGGCPQGGTITGNTNVTINGGTITRRLYGGCYNEEDNQTFHVTGNTTVTIGENLSYTKTGKSSGFDAWEGIRAGSRAGQNFADEVSTLVFTSTTAQNNHKNDLGKNADASMVSWAFGSKPAETTDSTVVK